jgi:hypothetical protein
LRAAANVEFGTSLQQAKANQIREWEQQEKEWSTNQLKKDTYKTELRKVIQERKRN